MSIANLPFNERYHLYESELPKLIMVHPELEDRRPKFSCESYLFTYSLQNEGYISNRLNYYSPTLDAYFGLPHNSYYLDCGLVENLDETILKYSHIQQGMILPDMLNRDETILGLSSVTFPSSHLNIVFQAVSKNIEHIAQTFYKGQNIALTLSLFNQTHILQELLREKGFNYNIYRKEQGTLIAGAFIALHNEGYYSENKKEQTYSQTRNNPYYDEFKKIMESQRK
ncbi:MAG: hypothetical protein ACP5N1_05730 [Candidatus Woesearchaeota archaeon]